MNWAQAHLAADDELSEKVFPQAVRTMVREQNTEMAANWVNDLPEGKLRAASAEYLVSEWSRFDHPAVGEWINQLEDGPTFEAAAATFADSIFPNNPQAALEWGESIQNVEKRKELLTKLGGSYMRTDKVEARKWIAATSLTPEEKSELIEEFE